MKRKKTNQAPKKAMLIVTSTEAESLFFSQMRKDCRYTNLTVQYAGGATDVDQVIAEAVKQRISGKYDVVWAVIGFDAFPLTFAQLRGAIAKAEAKKVKLAWNYPSLPIWYLLHVQGPRLPISDTTVIENSLKGIFPKFTASAQYLLDAGNSLHLKLFPLKAQAAVNASAYNSLVERRFEGFGATNMVKLVSEISDVCGLADVSHNQKLIGLKNS